MIKLEMKKTDFLSLFCANFHYFTLKSSTKSVSLETDLHKMRKCILFEHAFIWVLNKPRQADTDKIIGIDNIM